MYMMKYCAVLSCSVVSDSLQPHGLQPSRLLCPWEFSRQEYWSGLLCPPPGDLPNPGTEPRSPTLQVDSLPSEPPGKPDEILFRHKYNEIMRFVETWMDLEIFILNEVRQKEKDKYHYIIYMWNQIIQVHLFMKQKQANRHRKQIYSYHRETVWGVG